MKKLKGVVDTTRKQEEDVIEQLIECQMKIDRLTEVRKTQIITYFLS